jgi:TolB protein
MTNVRTWAFRAVLAAALLSVLGAATAAAWADRRPAGGGPLPGLQDVREVHLRNVRKLTHGGENAEAYFSFDGRRLVFQSRRDGLRADQIFIMGAEGQDPRRISTGQGRTTCAFFLPGDQEVIFSSTHGYSPEVPPEPHRSQGYVWPIYPYYAIWRARTDGTGLRPLFPPVVRPGEKVGYNAESTVSPDGKRIIFTSTRDGDLDLYTMSIDGTDLRRITRTLGYDGGAVFSPDSQWIAWRAFHPVSEKEQADYRALLQRGLTRPTRMELWVARADGTEARQITHNGAANFAPTFTPDGKHLVFSSNVDDPQRRRFELYRIGVDGTGLRRITYGREFDAFPMFSPDGKRLVWASNRNGKNRSTNVFVADWVP